MNTTTLLCAVLMLTGMPAAVWANAGPPHRPGRLVGEPNGLDSMAIKKERLSFDLRPLATAGPALVEAAYEIANTGGERTVDLVFVSGPMLFYVGLLFALAFPIGVAITLARASAARRSMAGAGEATGAPGLSSAI